MLDLEFHCTFTHTDYPCQPLARVRVENGGMMETQTTYIYLEHRPDKRTQELFIQICPHLLSLCFSSSKNTLPRQPARGRHEMTRPEPTTGRPPSRRRSDGCFWRYTPG